MNTKIATMMALQELGSRQEIINLVEKNTHAEEPSRMPLPTCPEMLMKDACEVCFWHNKDEDICKVEEASDEEIIDESLKIARRVLGIEDK